MMQQVALPAATGHARRSAERRLRQIRTRADDGSRASVMQQVARTAATGHARWPAERYLRQIRMRAADGSLRRLPSEAAATSTVVASTEIDIVSTVVIDLVTPVTEEINFRLLLYAVSGLTFQPANRITSLWVVKTHFSRTFKVCWQLSPKL